MKIFKAVGLYNCVNYYLKNSQKYKKIVISHTLVSYLKIVITDELTLLLLSIVDMVMM